MSDRFGVESIRVHLGELLADSNVSLAIWADVGAGERAVATREYIQRRLRFEVSVWLDAPARRVQSLARLARRFYPPDNDDIDPRCAPFIMRERQGAAFGFQPELVVPLSGKPPSPLFITDTAFFYYQMARLAAGMQPTRPDVGGYCAASPGKIKSVPGDRGILSWFECPVCQNQLPSVSNACERCGWER